MEKTKYIIGGIYRHHSGSQTEFSKNVEEKLATYGAVEMCFDWLIDWRYQNVMYRVL